jgi:hypothetical protein
LRDPLTIPIVRRGGISTTSANVYNVWLAERRLVAHNPSLARQALRESQVLSAQS